MSLLEVSPKTFYFRRKLPLMAAASVLNHPDVPQILVFEFHIIFFEAHLLLVVLGCADWLVIYLRSPLLLLYWALFFFKKKEIKQFFLRKHCFHLD